MSTQTPPPGSDAAARATARQVAERQATASAMMVLLATERTRGIASAVAYIVVPASAFHYAFNALDTLSLWPQGILSILAWFAAVIVSYAVVSRIPDDEISPESLAKMLAPPVRSDPPA